MGVNYLLDKEKNFDYTKIGKIEVLGGVALVALSGIAIINIDNINNITRTIQEENSRRTLENILKKFQDEDYYYSMNENDQIQLEQMALQLMSEIIRQKIASVTKIDGEYKYTADDVHLFYNKENAGGFTVGNYPENPEFSNGAIGDRGVAPSLEIPIDALAHAKMCAHYNNDEGIIFTRENRFQDDDKTREQFIHSINEVLAFDDEILIYDEINSEYSLFCPLGPTGYEDTHITIQPTDLKKFN